MTVKTPQLLELLRQRFCMEQGYALLENVANGVGLKANGRRRFADALAMEQWGKSGHYLHGFELKCSRADWLRELKDGNKADSVYRYCDFWWVVVGDPSILKDGELPKGWGLLAPRGEGSFTTLLTYVEAERQRDVAVHDRAFVASIFRRAKEQQVDKKLLAAEYERGRQAGRETERLIAEMNERSERQQLEQLRALVREFEEASGLTLGVPSTYGWTTSPADLGRAVKLVLAGERDIRAVEAGLNQLRMRAEQIIRQVDHALSREPSEVTVA